MSITAARRAPIAFALSCAQRSHHDRRGRPPHSNANRIRRSAGLAEALGVGAIDTERVGIQFEQHVDEALQGCCVYFGVVIVSPTSVAPESGLGS
jgi:hypothetical protein